MFYFFIHIAYKMKAYGRKKQGMNDMCVLHL